jgi:hypothetical protein
MTYVLIVLSGIYSVATTATVSRYSDEQKCREAGESYIAQASVLYPQDRFHFICTPAFEGDD